MEDNKKPKNAYTHEQRQKLADSIRKLRKKDHMIKIAEIIYEDNKNITENTNGLFMFFHKLNDTTYYKIDMYLRTLARKKANTDSDINKSETDSEKNTLSKYHSQSDLYDDNNEAKLKYSNKERNLIKRHRYEEQLISNQNSETN